MGLRVCENHTEGVRLGPRSRSALRVDLIFAQYILFDIQLL